MKEASDLKNLGTAALHKEFLTHINSLPLQDFILLF
jgi:hypothetical protein